MSIFGEKLVSGRVVGAQKNLVAKINAMQEVLENLDCILPLELSRDDRQWRIKESTSGNARGYANDIASIVDNTLTLKNVCYRRGPLTFKSAATVSTTLTGTACDVSLKVDLDLNTVTLDSDYDTGLPAENSVKILLYSFGRADDNGAWQVLMDWRDMPEIASYV